MCFEHFTAFVALEGWPGWTILNKQHLEIFNLQRRRENLSESSQAFLGARIEDVPKRCLWNLE